MSDEEPGVAMPPLAHRIVGAQFDLIAADGDSFTKIGSRLGEAPRVLAQENGKQVGDRLHAGDTVHIDNRHIVPFDGTDLIEVNLPQRMLFHFKDGRVSGVYPVAIGQPGKQWQTPTGSFTVIQMKENPTWRPPASIQREEEEQGKDVIDEIEPGPDNPLGKYWIGLSFPVVGIHGTNHPVSVYSYRTHGCVRLHPDDIEALFNTVDLNDRGETIYVPLMLAQSDDGHIFLESEKDIYGRGTPGIDGVRALARADGIDNLVDWNRAGEVVTDQDGIARDVTATSERAGGAPADTVAATEVERTATVTDGVTPAGLIATALPPD
jgi:L,D-transpeptidase ErfK/SrfK